MRVKVVGPLRVAGACRGEIVDLDQDQVNIPALIAAGHVQPAPAPQSKKAKGQ